MRLTHHGDRLSAQTKEKVYNNVMLRTIQNNPAAISFTDNRTLTGDHLLEAQEEKIGFKVTWPCYLSPVLLQSLYLSFLKLLVYRLEVVHTVYL